MKCPVCDKENKSMLCPECGFDSSRDYERHPSFGSVEWVPAVSAWRKDWKEKQKPEEPTQPVQQPVLEKPVEPDVSQPEQKAHVTPEPVVIPEPEPTMIPQQVKKRKIPSWLIAAAFALALVLGVLIGSGMGGSQSEPSEPGQFGQIQDQMYNQSESISAAFTPVDSDTAYRIAMITDYEGIADQSFNQTTYEACMTFAQKNNIPFNYYAPFDNSTAELVSMVDAAVTDGHNIIVMPGFAFGEVLGQCASSYPDVKFVALDPGEGDGGFQAMENVYSAVYKCEIAGFMAGYAAVEMGYKHLGFLGGMAVPDVQRYGYGFLQGVDAAAKERDIVDQIKVEYIYAGQYFGDANITAVMDMWYGDMGVECVFACGGGIWTSAAEAAGKMGGKLIGIDVDQAPVINGTYGEGMTVTSAMKGLANTVEDILSGIILEDNWVHYAGKIESLGLVSADPEANYVQLPMGSTAWNEGFTQNDYRALVADLYDGTIVVSDQITQFPLTAVTVEVWPNIK